MASSFKLTFNRIGDQQNLLLCFSSLRQESFIRDLLRIVNNDGHKIGEPAEADSLHVHRFYDAAFAIREIASSFGFTVITKNMPCRMVQAGTISIYRAVPRANTSSIDESMTRHRASKARSSSS